MKLHLIRIKEFSILKKGNSNQDKKCMKRDLQMIIAWKHRVYGTYFGI